MYKFLQENQPEKDRFFGVVFRNAASGMAITDRQGRILKVNNYLCEFLGYSEAELLGHSFNDLSHRDDAPVFAHYVERLTEGETFHMERRFVHKYGQVEWGLHSVFSVPESNGLYLSQVQEITEFKRVEEELQQSEERLRLAFSVLAEGIVLQEAGGCVQMNGSARRMLGIYADAITQGQWAGVFVDENGATVPTELLPMQLAMATGEAVSDKVLGVRNDDGMRWALVNARPIFHEGTDAPVGVVTSFTDVTERRELEEQLRHSQRMESVGRLAGGMAHDFNNLLMAILGEASVRLMDPSLPPELRRSFEMMTASARRGASLTRKLLTFSRHQVFERRVLDLHSVVGSLRDMLQRLLSGRVSFAVSTEPNSLVLADRNMIEQVLINLAVNANDAMPDGGMLFLQLTHVDFSPANVAGHRNRRPGRFVCLSVRDTGAGMDADTQARVFEPYYTTKAVGKGTGLGLSIVYGIIKQHGGWIELQSRPGAGTDFRIYLEAAPNSAQAIEAPLPAVPAAEPQPKPNAVRRQSILVVEDDEGIRALLQAILGGEGYRVLTARSGAEGLTLLQKHRETIELLLTDVLLDPEMNGFELAANARELAPEMPIIFASGYQEQPPPADTPLHEGENFLAKPFEIVDLLAAIRKALYEHPKK